jgi:antitoxin component YwqK of YwqJK toxin-antitoxin module
MAKGGGVWIWESCYEDGKVARKIPLKGNRFDGKAEGFYHTGKPQFTAEYRQGELNGEVVKFDDEGQENSRQTFKDGKPERGSKGEEN